ncbi:MAG TPA: hypothetical protein VM889_12230 [Candidatus Thermoplasmatota archaeon]|nr:hypothetical protein [Candidatus Thermoplasmatota archaeon]
MACRPFRAFALALLLVAPSALAQGESLATYEVTWSVSRETYTATGHLVPGETRLLRLRVETMNVTQVSATVSWNETDDPVGLSGPDTFSASLYMPDKSRAPGSPVASASGKLDVRAVVARPPESMSVRARDADDLRAKLASYASSSGSGAWHLEVRLEDVGNPHRAEVDKGNSFDVVITVHAYEAAAMRIVTLAPAPRSGGQAFGAGFEEMGLWTWASGALAVVALGLGGVLWRRR